MKAATRAARWAAGLTVGTALLMSAGCAAPGVTQAGLQRSVALTFANLYVRQQRDLDRPLPRAADLQSHASCKKGTVDTADAGPGPDWVCYVVWLVDGPGTPATAQYTLTVAPDGCFTADGDGPVSINGQRLLATASGTVANPLYAFDGCFPID